MSVLYPPIQEEMRIRSNIALGLRPRAISRASGCKIPALGKSLGPRGVYFPIHPSSRQCTDSLCTRSCPPQARAIKLRIAPVLVEWSHAGGGETNIDQGQYWLPSIWHVQYWPFHNSVLSYFWQPQNRQLLHCQYFARRLVSQITCSEVTTAVAILRRSHTLLSVHFQCTATIMSPFFRLLCISWVELVLQFAYMIYQEKMTKMVIGGSQLITGNCSEIKMLPLEGAAVAYNYTFYYGQIDLLL